MKKNIYNLKEYHLVFETTNEGILEKEFFEEKLAKDFRTRKGYQNEIIFTFDWDFKHDKDKYKKLLKKIEWLENNK